MITTRSGRIACCIAAAPVVLLVCACASTEHTGGVVAPSAALLEQGASRTWLGAELWANPWTDWRLENGRAENTHAGGERGVACLTRELCGETPIGASFEVAVEVELLERGSGVVGVQFGRRGRFDDARDDAVHGRGAYAGIVLDGSGAARLVLGAVEVAVELREPTFDLRLAGVREADGWSLELTGASAQLGIRGVPADWIDGALMLLASTDVPKRSDLTAPRPEFAVLPAFAQARGGALRAAFAQFEIAGDAVRVHRERAFGPILWCQHTVSTGTLVLQAQVAPLDASTHRVALELDGQRVADAPIDADARTATFTVPGLDLTREHAYAAVLERLPAGGGAAREIHRFTGRIRAEPKQREFVIASLSCADDVGFPHQDIVENVTDHRPDLVTFHGDQLYEGVAGYGLLRGDGERPILDYLRKWALFGWTWRELLRDTPCVVLPDDHDVYHGNLWGAGGRATRAGSGQGSAAQDTGGYKQPPRFVNVVHRTQTGHLPACPDPAPCQSGISVYFTALRYGPLDAVILADRQWKSAPAELLPEAAIDNGWAQNLAFDARRESDVAGAVLLGERQHAFLADFARARCAERPLCIALSQTPFCCIATLPADVHHDAAVPNLPILAPGEYPPDDRPVADFDANGWPRSQRDAALRLLQRAGVRLHIAGDQHLGSTGVYGIDQHGDGPTWLATPAIANLWPRRWFPSAAGDGGAAGPPRTTGEFRDGFGNAITVLAVANPTDQDREPARLFDRAVGYAITRYDPATGALVVANWPRSASPRRAAPLDRPFAGWPIEVK